MPHNAQPQNLHPTNAAALQETEIAMVHFGLVQETGNRRRAEDWGMATSESGLAHELNQPLGVIANYASGCLRRLESGTADKQALVHAFLRIAEQAERAGRISHRLRSLVAADLNFLLSDVVSLEAVDQVGGTGCGQRLAAPSLPQAERVTVFVVDDDKAMRESLSFLLEALGWEVRLFVSAQDFLARYFPPLSPACLLLEVRMPGMSGLDLQAILGEYGIELPTIMSAACADVPMAVRAMNQGAVDFLEKPFDEHQLRDSIEKAVARDSDLQRTREQRQAIHDRLARLTPREREVMQLVVRGLLNKQIASELALSMKTVEQHRGRVMEKMEADSLASLVRMAMAAGLT
jgi:two-component system, LuxR family, response regulator FixJ